VSVQLTPEICINKASSNSRLTAEGRWATASDTIHRTVSRCFFFFFLPSFDETATELHLHAEKLTVTVLHLKLGHFVVFFLFCVVLFGLVWFGFFPLWWDNRTTSEIPSLGLEAKGQTPRLLRLKLYCIWTWRFFYSFFIIFFQSSLCLSNACSAYCWLVHYLSLIISLKHFLLLLCFVCFFVLFFQLICLFVFPFSLTSLLSISSHPSILDITSVIITS
jgi:hypothetical protein